MGNIYGATFPPVFDFHFYGQAEDNWILSWNYLSQQGHTQGWIIGEAYYDDQQEASELFQAWYYSGYNPTIWYLTQWTVSRGSEAFVNPVSFTNYINAGF